MMDEEIYVGVIIDHIIKRPGNVGSLYVGGKLN